MHLLNAQKVRKTHRLWVLRAYAASRFGNECNTCSDARGASDRTFVLILTALPHTHFLTTLMPDVRKPAQPFSVYKEECPKGRVCEVIVRFESIAWSIMQHKYAGGAEWLFDQSRYHYGAAQFHGGYTSLR